MDFYSCFLFLGLMSSMIHSWRIFRIFSFPNWFNIVKTTGRTFSTNIITLSPLIKFTNCLRRGPQQISYQVFHMLPSCYNCCDHLVLKFLKYMNDNFTISRVSNIIPKIYSHHIVHSPQWNKNDNLKTKTLKFLALRIISEIHTCYYNHYVLEIVMLTSVQPVLV